MTTISERSAQAESSAFGDTPGLLELLLIAGCFAPLVVSVPAQTGVRFLSFICWAPLLYHWRNSIFVQARRTAIIFLLPGLLMLSLIWTPDKVGGAKYVGLMLFGLSTVVCVVARASFRQVITIMLLASAFAAFASYLQPNTHNVYRGETAAIGLYEQKNVLGKRMMSLCLLAAYVAVAPGVNKPIRMVGLVGAALGFVLVIQSNSATALVLTSIGVFLVIAASGLLQGFARLRGGLILFCLIGFMVLVGVAYYASLQGLQPMEFVLNALGKDPTLTGRTTLWGYAEAFIAEHPFLGAGVEGFWKPNRDEAVWIASTYNEEGSYRYYFHSSYLEFGVHAGVPAIIALGLTHLFMVSVAVRDLFKFRDPQGALTFAMVANTAIRSFTESDFYSKAEVNVLVPWIAVGFALKRYAEEKRGVVTE